MQLAFPQICFQFLKTSGAPNYSWCAQIQGADKREIDSLEQCLHLFHRTLWIDTTLDECYALGWHSKVGGIGKPALTTLGQWIHMAKAYGSDADSSGSETVAGLIAEQMVEFMRRHPGYRRCDGLVSVLPSNPDKAFDLPRFLAKIVAEETGIPYLDHLLYKKRPTAQMKYCPRMEDKLDNIAGSVGVHAEEIQGKRLILIDDILESGITLTETAKTLRSEGVASLHGLVATKTLKRKFA